MKQAADLSQAIIGSDEAYGISASFSEGLHAQAMLRIDQNFLGIGKNADQHGYDLAQQVINGDHQWVEHGIV